MNSYTKTDQQVHYLCQVIAKANRTYLAAKDDDSHTNLYFDSVANRITGRWIMTQKGEILLTLNLDTLSFEFFNAMLKVVAEVSIISKTMDSIEKEIESLLPSLGLNPEGFSTKLHFEIPQYDFTNKPFSQLEINGIKVWREYREIANEACFSLLGYAQASAEIRIWPHHFDTGIYFKAHKKIGVGLGLAMEDDMAGAPYFYTAAYPEEGEIEYKNLPLGDWEWKISDHWKGAVLSLEELEKYPTAEKKKVILNYIITVYKWIITQ